jgi:hypothetical protein
MTHDPVFEAIANLSRLATDLMPLNAIWLEKPLQMEGKRSIRITKGDLVRVKWNELIDCTKATLPTHEIIECRGNLYNTMFEVDLRDLKTNEPLTIKL